MSADLLLWSEIVGSFCKSKIICQIKLVGKSTPSKHKKKIAITPTQKNLTRTFDFPLQLIGDNPNLMVVFMAIGLDLMVIFMVMTLNLTMIC